MFGISLAECFIIIVFTFVFIPVKDLPKVVRFCAKTYNKIQKIYYQFLREINLLDLK